tara:strand:- start:596957 stop:597469 length:513 start_codon:yes stop_codon:yes gene_type:complete
MSEHSDINELSTAPVKRGGGVYLIVSDKPENCEKLLYYVMRLAQKNEAYMGIIHATQLPEYQHWSNVEQQIKSELRAHAEEEVYGLAQRITDHMDNKPVFYFCEGELTAEIIKTIKADKSIVGLYLSGRSASTRQEELVKYFVGKGMDQLDVPITIIPEHLDLKALDELF